MRIIMHNIRSAHNVGSVFRTADGLGVSKVHLTGYTPRPFGEGDVYLADAQKKISKTALGAERFMPWEKEENIFFLIDKLKKENFQIISLELAEESVDLKNFTPRFPCALILGAETTGIEKDILATSDAIVKIPMRGKKESFNVSVAAGIAVYEILNKH